MISPELLRRYPFFAGLSHEQIVALAKVAEEVDIEPGYYFFHEGDEVENFYLVVEGEVAIVIEIPAHGAKQTVAEQYARDLKTNDVVTSAVGPGDVFGWSAIISPYKASAGAKSTRACRVVAFDGPDLRDIIQEDCAFGLLLMEKAAQVSRDRLHDLRIESLAHYVG